MSVTSGAEQTGAANGVVMACVALGSNLGDRAATLSRAVEMLRRIPGTRLEAVSGFVETAAVRVGDAEPGGPYLNGAARLATRLSAAGLHEHLQRIEAALGRVREGAARGAARTIDLDLLLYGEAEIDTPALRVPHPRMHERAFVLGPLAEVAAEAMVPGRGRVGALWEDVRAAMRSGPRALVIAVLAAGLACAHGRAEACERCDAAGQPRTGADTVRAIDPGIVLGEVAGAYGAGPWAERVTVTLRHPGKPARDADLIVRYDPGSGKVAAGGESAARPEALAVEMGVLRLFASGGALMVTMTENAETVYRAEFPAGASLTPALVAGLVRPLPLVQLALVRAGGEADRLELPPYLAGVRWRDAEMNPKEDHPAYRMRGRAAGVEGEYEMVVDAATGRLRRAAGPLRGDGQATWEMSCVPVPVGDRARWVVETADRRRVATLAELRLRGVEVGVGQRLPFDVIGVRNGDGAGVRLADVVARHAEATHVALVLWRPPSDGPEGVPADRAEASQALASALGAVSLVVSDGGGRGGARVVSVGVVVPSGFAEPEGPRAGTVPARPVERLVSGALAAVIVVDRGMMIRAAEAVEAEADPRVVAGRIAERLR